jgi:hypothetical protein
MMIQATMARQDRNMNGDNANNMVLGKNRKKITSKKSNLGEKDTFIASYKKPLRKKMTQVLRPPLQTEGMQTILTSHDPRPNNSKTTQNHLTNTHRIYFD